MEINSNGFLKTASSVVLPQNLGDKKKSKVIAAWDAKKSMVFSTQNSESSSSSGEMKKWENMGQMG